MTRDELYDLVWQTPMTRLAKRFGMSDAGLKKICKMNDIPTPPLGYWAKRAAGKRVTQPTLPPSRSEHEAVIPLTLRMSPDTPPEVTAGQEAAMASEQGFSAVVVSAERPSKLHPVAAETSRAFRSAKKDDEGFKTCSPRGGVSVSIGPGSVDRTLRIIDACLTSAPMGQIEGFA
ncbi:MAG: hypothetical protein Kow00114_16630 [Kiloniellaceae bacterium]